MDFEETAVDTEFDNEVADDALPEEVIEEEESEEESLESLTEDEGQPEEKPQPQQASEPGYIKGRISKAVQKAVSETEARMQAKFDEQLAPLRERLLEMDAQELVRKGTVKDLEVAKELVRYRQGQPQAEAPQPQPRNEQGQFAPKEDPKTSARIDMLAHQADRIKERTGVDVIEVFNTDEEIKAKVISGEMDFYDVAETMKQAKSKRRPPAPMRTPNGASGRKLNAIDTMSDEQFARMEKNIDEGARYSLK